MIATPPLAISMALRPGTAYRPLTRALRGIFRGGVWCGNNYAFFKLNSLSSLRLRLWCYRLLTKPVHISPGFPLLVGDSGDVVLLRNYRQKNITRTEKMKNSSSGQPGATKMKPVNLFAVAGAAVAKNIKIFAALAVDANNSAALVALGRSATTIINAALAEIETNIEAGKRPAH